MSLINLLIIEPADIDLRISIRAEFQLLGINEAIEALKKIENTVGSTE